MVLATTTPSSSFSSSSARVRRRRSRDRNLRGRGRAVLVTAFSFVALRRTGTLCCESFSAPAPSTVGQFKSTANDGVGIIRERWWNYKGFRVGWEEARKSWDDVNKNSEEEAEGEPILLLNGFGVGSFHQHRLMPELVSFGEEEDDSSAGRNGSHGRRTVYGVDYLGQGRSWPIDCDDGNSPNEAGVRYCIDSWSEQIESFLEEVVLPAHRPGGKETTRVHLVGNSVGGHLSVLLASKRPDLIRSVVLINATPVWGLNLPGWDGRLPPPTVPRAVGRYLFDKIRDLSTIGTYLEGAYKNREAFDDDLCRSIRGCTEGKGGHAAFASILWSPPATFPSPAGAERTDEDFYANLQRLKCDALLVFGKDDPWCKPAFARRMNRALAVRPEGSSEEDEDEGWDVCHRYVEISNAGHCPNHEAPRAVGRVVRRWIGALERGEGKSAALVVPKVDGADGKEEEQEEEEAVAEPSWGGKVTMRDMTACHADGSMWADVSWVDRLVSRFL